MTDPVVQGNVKAAILYLPLILLNIRGSEPITKESLKWNERKRLIFRKSC
jgi:hypothetical protein